MSETDFSFDTIDFSILNNSKEDTNKKLIKNCIDTNTNNEIKYDNTTNETYRIKRLFRIDPFTDQEIPSNLIFEFEYTWNPYTGIRDKIDPIGPLCFNAVYLYDYFYSNRYKGLWNPPVEQFQGYYGDLLGASKGIKIKSRGTNPERYLFRLPIIDCYLPPTHNFSIITMGPELTDNEISKIDLVVQKSHPKRTQPSFATLTMIKFYYDNALNSSPDPNSDEIKELKKKYPTLTENEINEKYNRFWVDKLVKLKY